MNTVADWSRTSNNKGAKKKWTGTREIERARQCKPECKYYYAHRCNETTGLQLNTVIIEQADSNVFIFHLSICCANDIINMNICNGHREQPQTSSNGCKVTDHKTKSLLNARRPELSSRVDVNTTATKHIKTAVWQKQRRFARRGLGAKPFEHFYVSF